MTSSPDRLPLAPVFVSWLAAGSVAFLAGCAFGASEPPAEIAIPFFTSAMSPPATPSRGVIDTDDRDVEAAARERLGRDPRFGDIEVRVINGTAVLSGPVARLEDGVVAQREVGDIPGLVAVHDTTEVTAASPQHRPGQAKVAALEKRLEGIEGAGEVDVDYADGYLDLVGPIPAMPVREEVLRAAREVDGVVGVVDHLRVAAPEPRADVVVAQEIREALRDDPFTAGRGDISVDVVDGRVVLAGRVPTLAVWERVVARSTVKGVRLVDANALEIGAAGHAPRPDDS
ncbi:MAG: BON domain-containing protein [Myxococcota bacterium]